MKGLSTMTDTKRPIRAVSWLVPGLLLLFLLLGMGCQEEADAGEQLRMPGGDARRGATLIEAYGCPACHTIPGIQGADALVGPPLNGWSERVYIAGSLANTPENLLLWLQNPQRVEPGTAMPDMGITEEVARDIGAYLYTLTPDGPAGDRDMGRSEDE